jgi:hypothetical protein
MTLSARIKLINDMVRENPDTTIKDYLELVRDLEGISEKTKADERFILLCKIKKPMKINRDISERYKQMNIAHKL